MTASRTCPQLRTGLALHWIDNTLEILDTTSEQRWRLSPVESLVWQQLVAAPAAGNMADWVRTVCDLHPAQLTAARVWAALDALADRGLLQGRAAPPAVETVSQHQRLSRRQWAVAGLAMAAAPAAFASTVAAAEEKAKLNAQAPTPTDGGTDDPAVARRQEQEQKRQQRSMQEEKVKGQRSAEQNQKRAARQQEENQKLSSRQQEQQRKQAAKAPPSDEAPKPF